MTSLAQKLFAFAFIAVSLSLTPTYAHANTVVVGTRSNLATIKGIVRDENGSPIADATVAIFRLGTSKLLKQVRSASDGAFLAKILPGKYTILAVAEGFNPVTLPEVQINSATLSSYGFKLERAGGGNTLPEKRLDRNNPKWLIRSGMLSRGTYQIDEGGKPSVSASEESVEIAEVEAESKPSSTTESVVETYAGSGDKGNFAGLNFATAVQIGRSADALFAAQTGVGAGSPLRLESQLKFRPNDNHQIRFKTGFVRIGELKLDDGDAEDLSQISVQATDEWKVREGIVLVYGFDYAKFVGGGGDYSLNPRLGFQYDIDSKTRFRSSYAAHTEERTWSRAIELEDAEVVFRDPVSIDDVVIESGQAVMNRSTRFELGIERVLDNRSSVELSAFFDTTFARGVGLAISDLSPAGNEFSELVGNQQGSAHGVRLVYSRRLSGVFSAAAGYSFGTGQSLSPAAVTDPGSLFETAYFHTAFGQIDADFSTGTSVRTVFRLSPDATVFAIDPFQGRLAIYDPSLSVLVTQSLPTLGLPFRAQASVDARNILGFQTGIAGETGSLRMNSHRRALRGSIMVRF